MTTLKPCSEGISNFASRNPTDAGDAVPRAPWDIFGKKKDTGRAGV